MLNQNPNIMWCFRLTVLLIAVSLSPGCKKDAPSPDPNTGSDVVPPQITVVGGNFQSQSLPNIAGTGIWINPGATAQDINDGNLDAYITISGTVDPNTKGTYLLTYSVADAAGNTAVQEVTVNILNDAEMMAGIYTVTDSSSLSGISVYNTHCLVDSYVNNLIRMENFGNFGFSTNVPMTVNTNQSFTVPVPLTINSNTIQSLSGTWGIQSSTVLLHFNYTYTDGSNTVTCSADYIK